ncbi:hypothetical protein [Orenia marismortui]|uniref:hypothetical protein n=1 Tax=Orenia marismortui TaxID=46469 RepID=UPI000369FE4C|nr:hypothetical protein [Orenia marismortui]
MFSNKIPYFKRGNILKKGMLENLRDYPRNFLNLYFNDYSDGIISGCDILIEDDYLCINQGIIKFNGLIYIMDQFYKINYSNTNKEVLIKVKFFEAEDSRDYKNYSSEILLDENLKLADDEFELARFKLREGAKLRANYSSFADFDTEYNTINIINVAYSNHGQSTLHPLIVSNFAKEILARTSDDSLDLVFAMECLNSRAVNRDLMISYVSKKLALAKEEYSNLELYKYMKKIIKSLSYAKEDKRNSPRRQSKIIVD